MKPNSWVFWLVIAVVIYFLYQRNRSKVVNSLDPNPFNPVDPIYGDLNND